MVKFRNLEYSILFFGLLWCGVNCDDALNDSTHLNFGGYYCWVRCIGKCLQIDSSRLLEECGQECLPYKNDSLCTENTCWLRCKELVDGVQAGPNQPSSLRASYGTSSYDPYSVSLNWSSVSGAQMYVLQYKDMSDVFMPWSKGGSGSVETLDLSYQFRKPVLCPSFQFRVAAVNSKGVSEFSTIANAPTPIPVLPDDASYSLMAQIWYADDVWYDLSGARRDNATLYADLNFTLPTYWGIENFTGADLLSSHPQCSRPDLSQAYPATKYALDKSEPVIHAKMPATVMRQSCLSVFKLESLQSVCGTLAKFPSSQLISTRINCDTIQYSPCNLPKKQQLPFCTVDKLECNVSETGLPCDQSSLPVNTTATVEISWTMQKGIKGTPLYYVVRWGPGTRPGGPGQILDIIQLSSVTEVLRTCDSKRQCTTATRIELAEIPVGQLVGVQICAVFDEKLEFYNRSVGRIGTHPIEIAVEVEGEKSSGALLAIAITIPLGIALLVFVCALCFLCRRHKAQTKKVERLQYEMSQMENEDRYTAMPRKHDIWEIERRNLIINPNQKLGSGAFGAVFMGKIAGKVLGPKDSTSALATNLMRVENADVAVKMLPEYADELSKADFLKEINLMKKLGYHERLVNMMACITDSEPYCLIVEYCSDGDLLHFLRHRCKYMMKLDEQGIDYTSINEEGVELNFDPNFVLSLKELLGFAVQCSVGLEYLSQKGFIHRDVAARNVLVHDKKYAKIGDFGLCRYVYGSDSAYWGKGGRLPIKWMSPEAIKNYEFTTKSDIWSFGVLLFEIITMGGCPYPGIQPGDMEQYLEQGGRMDRPDNCPEQYYSVMMDCWELEPEKRLHFTKARELLAKMLEETVADYSYLSLNQQRDYYNVPYSEREVQLVTTESHLTENNLESVTLSFENRAFDESNSDIQAVDAQLSEQKEPVAALENPTFEKTAEESSERITVPQNTSRNADRHDSGLDLGADSVSVSSNEEITPPALPNAAPPIVPPRRSHDSAGSDRFLITPNQEDQVRANRFRFSFTALQERLGKVPEAESTNYDGESNLSSAISNDSYSDFLIKNPRPEPPPRRGV